MDKIEAALLVFIAVSILDIIGIIFNIPSLIFVFKPLILLSLLVLYSISVSLKNKDYIAALLFSFFGDVFLLFSGELYFIIGLISFLIAHLLFIKIVVKRIERFSFLRIVILIIPFMILFFALIFVLYNSLNELLIPVIIYGVTISTFGIVSLLDYLNTKSTKSLLMLIGAIIFIISDSILAINKFYTSTEFFLVMVMVSYVIAQYFIYRSMVLEANENN